MSERPIIFSPDSVRAILAGTKTQTRRVIKGAQTTDPVDQWIAAGQAFRCPYGGHGDLLWVKETWAAKPGGIDLARPASWYAADFTDHRAAGASMGIVWRNAMYMPIERRRLTLRVTEVRVERVRDISDYDCHCEGVALTTPSGENYVEDYARLWDSINAKRGYGWDSNPWVWCVSFEVVR